MKRSSRFLGGAMALLMVLTLAFRAFAEGAPSATSRSGEWRSLLLDESARLKTAIQRAANLPADYFIAFPEQDATEEQLEKNLVNLLIASYGLRIADPVVGDKAPRRVSDGISHAMVPGMMTDIEACRKEIEERLPRIQSELERGWDADLALEELRLKASARFWENELERLIRSLRITQETGADGRSFLFSVWLSCDGGEWQSGRGSGGIERTRAAISPPAAEW